MENMEYVKRAQIIGLTGGIGSGKSTIALEFEKLGVPVFYSDDFAKTAYFNPDIKKFMLSLLGEKVYLSETEIDKTFLRNAIFQDPSIKSAIESKIHPFVRVGFENFCKKHHAEKYIINESALLFEKKLMSQFDKIILVTAPLDLRIERVSKRDNIDTQSLLKVIDSQMPDNEKITMADFVILNEELPEIPSKVYALHELLISSIF